MFLPFLLVVLQWATSSEAYKIGDCGILYNKYNPHTSGGDSKGRVYAENNEYPWHVAIYMNSTSGYQYICGGTFLDKDSVITAAGCVVKKHPIVVIAGKINSSWDHHDINEQRLQVVRKMVPTTDRGEEIRYQDNIAILVLNDTIRFSDLVMPACVEWETSHQPTDGELGKFPGWGYGANGSSIEKLQGRMLRTLSFIDCRKKTEKVRSSVLTSDKFCTTTPDRSTSANGDAGGGIVFLRNFSAKKEEVDEKYYLYGVLIGGSSTDYYLFTNVSSYTLWQYEERMQLLDKSERSKSLFRV